MHIKEQIKHRASFFDIREKSREITQDIRKRIVDFHKSGLSLMQFQMPEDPMFNHSDSNTQV